MKEKIKTTCLILITISIIVFAFAYAFRALIDFGCSSPNLYSVEEEKTGLAKFASRQFLGITCIIWSRAIQIQQNY